MKIIIVGTGYVGLVTGACLAEIGHHVSCVDVDDNKIAKLQKGEMPFFEPGLQEIIASNVQSQRLNFTTSLPSVLEPAEVVVIAVGTPSLPDGQADLQYVFAVAEEIANNIKSYKVIVNKSTVPVGTGQEVARLIKNKYSGEFDVVSCPEFLREGSAVKDFMNPDRIVIGARGGRAAKIMLDVFMGVKGEKFVTSVESAELIKYASNAFLATKISFINEIAHLCERAGADIEEVAYGVGLDRRIGPKFLRAGIGWGGSCFPKDVTALDHIAGAHGYDFKLLKAVIDVNNHQRRHFVERIKDHCGTLDGKIIAVFGLAFKANTDDVRESAALDLIHLLRGEGAHIRACDYEAVAHAKRLLGETNIFYSTDPYETAQGAAAVVIATEWPQFKQLNWLDVKKNLQEPVIFDGRNLLDPARMRHEYGFTYYAIGRGNDQNTVNLNC